MSVLSEWDSFYLIVGPAAGALIGLQFVVMTLIADRPTPVAPEVGQAFATPTVVHFSACLLLSALVRVPWPSPVFATWIAGAIGLGGLAYTVLLVRRMRQQQAYQMDAEDGTFHVALPALSYGLLIVSAWIGLSHLNIALFSVGFAALVLLFAGIHNAWDAVAYQVYVLSNKPKDQP
jgi:hypothetical protein